MAEVSAPVVERLWLGETVAILGCGPGLTADDVNYVRGKAKVIAINTAWTLAPWADVLYSSDKQWWQHYKGVPAFQGMKYGIGTQRGSRETVVKGAGIIVLKNTGDEGLQSDPGGLKTGKHSGAAAINLAVHFGAARILLLGYNLGHVKGRAHFFGDHPPGLKNQSPFGLFIRMLATQVKPLAELGIEVLNCTRHSALACFPKADLRSVLVADDAPSAPVESVAVAP